MMMCRQFLILLNLLTPGIVIHSQPSATQILEKSRKFYLQNNSGVISIHTSFKSPIAESSSQYDYTIFFCKKENILISIPASGKNAGFSDKNKFYLFDNTQQTYRDLSDKKELKADFVGSLAHYPFCSPDLFTELSGKKWGIETTGNSFRLFDNGLHYLFDTTNFAILECKEVVFSSYGVQVKEWRVISQEFYGSCNDSIGNYASLRLKLFEQVNPPKIINPVLTGRKINHLLFEPLLKPVNSPGLSKLDFENKYILLDFFTQSCLPCITSFPRLKELQKLSLLKQNLIILGFDPNPEDSATMLKFINRYRLDHGIITGASATKLNILVNPVNIFPYYILIDPSGRVIAVEEGYNEEFFKRIEVLIKGKD